MSTFCLGRGLGASLRIWVASSLVTSQFGFRSSRHLTPTRCAVLLLSAFDLEFEYEHRRDKDVFTERGIVAG